MADSPETPAAIARRLIRSLDRATLATTLPDTTGPWPYASLVLTATDMDGSPLLLISSIAVHTKNLAAAARSSLLFENTAGLDDPLTGARVTVLGDLTPDNEPRLHRRFIARHPAAALYGNFHDFQIYRMRIERAHLIAGFGRIHWIDATEVIYPARTEWLHDSEAGALEHMNKDHAASIDLYAQNLLELAGSGWSLTGIDPEGADLRRSGSVARLTFPAPVENLDAVRHVFAALAQSAKRGAMSQ